MHCSSEVLGIFPHECQCCGLLGSMLYSTVCRFAEREAEHKEELAEHKDLLKQVGDLKRFCRKAILLGSYSEGFWHLVTCGAEAALSRGRSLVLEALLLLLP